MVLWQHFFLILALMIFFLKFLLKSVSKLSFFRLGVEILRFGVAICVAGVHNSFAFCKSVSTDRSGMAALL
jgi:hypothetical protein